MSSPWAKIDKPETLNLQEIMSEQVAADLANKEEQKFLKHFSKDDENSSDIYNFAGNVCDNMDDKDVDIDSDAEIARMLQAQFDREYDEELKRNEDKFNGTSKVCVSFKNFRRSSPSNDDESQDEEIEDIREKKDWDRFDAMEREIGSIPLCGYKMKDGNIITKHDTTISGRKNACKMLSFPPGFQTGDGENFDLKLSNKVFNSLKLHSHNEQSKKYKFQDKREDKATAMFGLDEHTTLLLYKMVNNQLVEAFSGVISTGKEAVIIHADGFETVEEQEIPREYVIKVFKTTLSEFKQRDKYIKGDQRFKDKIGKQTARKTVHIWAEKEMANLCRLKKAGIPCPEVISLNEHVLLMTFIGKDRIAAKKLKEADMDSADYIVAYDQIVEMMKTLFTDAKLIHSDLSEYNILWYHGQCYFIDVSQSVEPMHDNAYEFLLRDCNNVTRFFKRKSVPNVVSAEELFKSITGFNYDKEKLFLHQVTEKAKPHNIDVIQKEGVDSFERDWAIRTCERVVPEDPTLLEPPKA